MPFGVLGKAPLFLHLFYHKAFGCEVLGGLIKLLGIRNFIRNVDVHSSEIKILQDPQDPTIHLCYKRHHSDATLVFINYWLKI